MVGPEAHGRLPGGAAYVVPPLGGRPGPGVLVLHAWWGLTPFFRSVCDRLADEGFCALAPDLHHGRTASTPQEAESLLAAIDPNPVAALVMASAATLQRLPSCTGGPIGVVGFSMGASWGLWLSARDADRVGAVVAYYGTQDIDFGPAQAAYQGHFAEHDDLVGADQRVLLEADLRLLGRRVEFHDYPGTGHWFFEADRADAYDERAAALAWGRTVAFLRANLGDGSTAQHD